MLCIQPEGVTRRNSMNGVTNCLLVPPWLSVHTCFFYVPDSLWTFLLPSSLKLDCLLSLLINIWNVMALFFSLNCLCSSTIPCSVQKLCKLWDLNVLFICLVLQEPTLIRNAHSLALCQLEAASLLEHAIALKWTGLSLFEGTTFTLSRNIRGQWIFFDGSDLYRIISSY